MGRRAGAAAGRCAQRAGPGAAGFCIEHVKKLLQYLQLTHGNLAPVDITRTALSGTMGLFQTTGDEFAYLVDPRGYKISAVNPREHITIAFGCNE